uniref:Uncharacterized protein n=1 Tax=Panagrolaimus sp. JU765 TaxID=591449 RepID=A0AC34RDD0_9BILA
MDSCQFCAVNGGVCGFHLAEFAEFVKDEARKEIPARQIHEHFGQTHMFDEHFEQTHMADELSNVSNADEKSSEYLPPVCLQTAKANWMSQIPRDCKFWDKSNGDVVKLTILSTGLLEVEFQNGRQGTVNLLEYGALNSFLLSNLADVNLQIVGQNNRPHIIKAADGSWSTFTSKCCDISFTGIMNIGQIEGLLNALRKDINWRFTFHDIKFYAHDGRLFETPCRLIGRIASILQFSPPISYLHYNSLDSDNSHMIENVAMLSRSNVRLVELSLIVSDFPERDALRCVLLRLQTIVTKQATVFTMTAADNTIDGFLICYGFRPIGYSSLLINKAYNTMHMYKSKSQEGIAIYFGVCDKVQRNYDGKGEEEL